MPLGSRTYRLRLPEEVGAKANNLANLWGKDLDLSSDLVQVEKGPDAEKLHVHLRLPRESKSTTDWYWHHFSVSPSEKVQQVLGEGRVDLEKPRFREERDEEGEKIYYLEFQLLSPDEAESSLGISDRLRAESTDFWNRTAKLTVAILTFVLIAVIVYYVPGVPFRIVASNSMKPTLSQGDIVYTKSPQEIGRGDIISFTVPEVYQDQYGYPEHLIHRVVRIDGNYIETKGDATGEDPFKTRISNVTGMYGGFKIPLLGHLFLFFQTLWGRIYGGILLATLVLYSTIPPWLKKRRMREQRVDEALKSSMNIRESMASFSSAMSEYARHLKSHTTAIENLAESTEHLDEVVSNLEKEVEVDSSDDDSVED